VQKPFVLIENFVGMVNREMPWLESREIDFTTSPKAYSSPAISALCRLVDDVRTFFLKDIDKFDK